MSNVLRLDTPAVRRLLDDNPEFRFELQRAVIAEIVQHCIFKDPTSLVREVLPHAMKDLVAAIEENVGLFKEFERQVDAKVQNTKWSFAVKELKPEVKAAVEKQVWESIQAQVRESSLRISDLLGPIEERLKSYVDEKLPAEVTKGIDRHTEAEINRRVAERLSAIAQGIRGA